MCHCCQAVQIVANPGSSSAVARQAERHCFEYFRHGTLSLDAAFNTKTGKVLGKTAERPPRTVKWKYADAFRHISTLRWFRPLLVDLWPWPF